MSDKIKILISDDSILARKQLRDMLSEFGEYTIIEAKDGQAAIDQYKEINPDVVFLDIVMPVKDGIEAACEIIAYNPDAKIVMASSVGTQKYLKAAIEAGASEFIQKPLNREHVKKIITSLL